MLCKIIQRVRVELEQDYTQMKLMDLENEQLHQKAFAKDKRKAARSKLTSGQARHMTASEMLDLLARQTWESMMGDLFKEASERFKALRKAIDDHHKQIAVEKKAEEKARKAEEQHAKKLEAEAEKARMRAE
jgi:PHD/YefM family antitoxin component YafN of YafNO toxin-antitoxin module